MQRILEKKRHSMPTLPARNYAIRRKDCNSERFQRHSYKDGEIKLVGSNTDSSTLDGKFTTSLNEIIRQTCNHDNVECNDTHREPEYEFCKSIHHADEEVCRSVETLCHIRGEEEEQLSDVSGEKGGTLCDIHGEKEGSLCGIRDEKEGSLCGIRDEKEGSLCGIRGEKEGSLCGIRDEKEGTFYDIHGGKEGTLSDIHGKKEETLSDIHGKKEGILSDIHGKKEGILSDITEGKEGKSSDMLGEEEVTLRDIVCGKEVTPSDIHSEKEGTLSDIHGEKEGTLTNMHGEKEGTLSDMNDEKEGTLSDMHDEKEGTLSDIHEEKNGRLSEMHGKKEGTHRDIQGGKKKASGRAKSECEYTLFSPSTHNGLILSNLIQRSAEYLAQMIPSINIDGNPKVNGTPQMVNQSDCETETDAGDCLAIAKPDTFSEFINARNSTALGVGSLVNRWPVSSRCSSCNRHPGQRTAQMVMTNRFPDRVWHERCFVCFQCLQPLHQLTFCEWNEELLCVRHYDEKFHPRCAACDELVVRGTCLQAAGLFWHADHLRCSHCRVPINVGEDGELSLWNQKPFCPQCYQTGYENSCTVCLEPIKLPDCQVSVRDRHWHEECFQCHQCRCPLREKRFAIINQSQLICSECRVKCSRLSRTSAESNINRV